MPKQYYVPDCPKCGSKDVSEYIYGDADHSQFEELESQGHKFILEGCILDGPGAGMTHLIEHGERDGLGYDDENDSQTYLCNTCSHEYSWREWRAKQHQGE